MIYKRVIPNVTTAALTLGGGAGLVGCGGGDGPVESYCKTAADCYGYGSDGVDDCIEYYQNFLSYYDAACRSSIRSVLGCMSRLSCEDLEYDSYDACYDEYVEAYDTCDFDSYYE
ncbi:MAG: hypothetical protein ACODAU_12530 [Myxococcota bacterium]